MSRRLSAGEAVRAAVLANEAGFDGLEMPGACILTGSD